MSDELKRYDPEAKYIGGGDFIGDMELAKDGDWVAFRDYDALRAENGRLKEIILRSSRHQPLHNGRPSCPFCHNFVDSEEGKKP